jgi:hypothetical protein
MINYNELRNGQKFYGNGYKKGYEDAKKEFERPKGKWIKDDNGLIGCSHCRIVWLRGMTDFCPNCGADMREEIDNEC